MKGTMNQNTDQVVFVFVRSEAGKIRVKASECLFPASKFKKLDTEIIDLCLKRDNKLIRFLRDKLLKQNSIPEEIYKELFPSGSTPGVLYGLPKVHKTNCPARPILSTIGTYNYKLAKFFVPI